MIDLDLLKGGTDALRQALGSRGDNTIRKLEEVLELDGRRRQALKQVEDLRARKNEVSARIARAGNPKATPEGQALLAEAAAIKQESAALEAGLAKTLADFDKAILELPNPPHASVPVGKTPEDNKVVREDVSKKRSYAFKPLDHHELGERLGILDFAAAGKLSGSRFVVLKGAGAALERALIAFMLDLHIKEHGYTEIIPPYLVNAQTLTGTAQLPKFEEDQFKTTDENPLYLIPTAEVPLTNLHAGEILDPARLPLRYTAHTACFRREAGSYGKDTRGLIRQHQFNKVELVWICKPEESLQHLETLTRHGEEVLRRLELPYRVLQLCTGDVGFASRKTYDLEVWMAAEGRFREISSCSDCGDFQARRMKTRLKTDKAPALVHTLNGSGVAVGRAFACILEHYQQPDGSIEVPKVLRPYMGTDRIAKP